MTSTAKTVPQERAIPVDLRKKLSSGFEGVYILSSGNTLSCHEWLDCQWDDDEDIPHGAIYYDIYATYSHPLEDSEVIDGGVCGYGIDDDLDHFNDFLISSGQGQLLWKIIDNI